MNEITFETQAASIVDQEYGEIVPLGRTLSLRYARLGYYIAAPSETGICMAGPFTFDSLREGIRSDGHDQIETWPNDFILHIGDGFITKLTITELVAS